MKKVAIIGYAQHPILSNAGALNEVELIMPVVHQANSSVILKKGSKEFVLYEGDILENTYELVSVSPDEIVLSASGKLYKLENKVGK